MKKNFTLFILLVCLSFQLSAQNKLYPIVYYNVENLFDTERDTTINDIDFTPEGVKKWNDQKFAKKLTNLEEVFYKIAEANRTFPTIITVSEIENRRVLEAIVSMPKLLGANYQIIHYDSPDRRGIDVGLMYRPDQFKYEKSTSIPIKIKDWPEFATRDVLMVEGKIEGEDFAIFVNHWPSRSGGQYSSEPLRSACAEVVRHAVDSIQQTNPDIKIVVLGDFNDDPVDKSLAEVLGAKADPKDIENHDLFNPYSLMLKAGYGTLAYRDSWNIFDNIIVNGNLLNAEKGELRILKNKKSKFYGHIFNKSFLIQKSGQYKNYPFRTYSGNNFQGGYSDHFPVYILISK